MKASFQFLLILILSISFSSCTSTKRIQIAAKKKDYEKLDKYSESKDYRDRHAIAQSLNKYSDVASIDVIIKTAKYPDDMNFNYIVGVLDKFQNSKIKEFYIEELQNPNCTVLRKKYILSNFSKYVDDDSKPILRKLLTDSSDEIKLYAAMLLTFVSDYSGETVMAMHIQSKFFETQRLAVKVAGYFNNTDAYINTLSFYAYDDDPILRKNAHTSLQMLLGNNYLQQLTNDNNTRTEGVVESSEVKLFNSNSDRTSPKSPIDKLIPKSTKIRNFIYAVVIGNEDYSSFQSGLEKEADVRYALNDSKIFKDYLISTFGVPESNIDYYENAGSVSMNRAIEKLRLIAKNAGNDTELVFYYAGHGLPDQITKEPYLIPVDVTASDLAYAIKLEDLYFKLTEFPVRRVTVLLDACFTGGGREAGLIAARGVRIKPKENTVSGNLIVLSASSEVQTSKPYIDMEHGMFTYFLLKKIKESGGDIKYSELFDYVKMNVSTNSIMINNQEQTPSIRISPHISGTWGSWKFLSK